MINRTSVLFVLFLLLGLSSVSHAKLTVDDCDKVWSTWVPRDADANEFGFIAQYDVNDPRIAGKTVLWKDQHVLRPLLTWIWRNGRTVDAAKDAIGRLDFFGSKLRARADKLLNEQQWRLMFDSLHDMGNIKPSNLATSIMAVMKNNPGAFPKNVSPFDIQAIVAFTNGFGVAERVGENDWILHTMYDASGDGEKSVQTGRSGDTETDGFNDPSDPEHLDMTYKVATTTPDEALKILDSMSFYLLQNGKKGYDNLSDLAKDLWKSWAGVRAAEQIRNLIDQKLFTQNWEVPLDVDSELGLSFYSGVTGRPLRVMYIDHFLGIDKPIFTDETYNQWGDKNGNLVRRKAKFSDYTQRGSSPKPGADLGRTTRSGPAQTKEATFKLGELITQWEQAHNPGIVKRYAQAIGTEGKNLYKEWTDFTVSVNAKDEYTDAEVRNIAGGRKAWFQQVQKDANQIYDWILTQVPTTLPEVDLKQRLADLSKKAPAAAQATPKQSIKGKFKGSGNVNKGKDWSDQKPAPVKKAGGRAR